MGVFYRYLLVWIFREIAIQRYNNFALFITYLHLTKPYNNYWFLAEVIQFLKNTWSVENIFFLYIQSVCSTYLLIVQIRPTQYNYGNGTFFTVSGSFPVNTRRLPDVDLWLDQRCRRWAKQALDRVEWSPPVTYQYDAHRPPTRMTGARPPTRMTRTVRLPVWRAHVRLPVWRAYYL